MNEPYGMLVTAGQDDTVKVWDLCDGEQLGQLRGHKGGFQILRQEMELMSRICQSAASGRHALPDWRL